MDPLSFFSAEEIAVWAGQGRTNDLLSLTGLALKLGFLATVLATGLHLALRRACERAGGLVFRGRWVVDVLYPVGLMLLYTALILPFTFFTSYVLNHERRIATISLGLWWTDWAKTLLLDGLFFGLLGLGLFGLARRLPRTWWIWLWGAVVGMLLVWSMLSPFRARIYHDFTPLPEGETRRAIVELMSRVGLEPSHIQVIDTSHRSKRAVAYVMGDGPTRQVVLGDNLMREFHPREIRVALAHELGHERLEHKSRSWLTLAGAALLFLLLVHVILWGAPRVRRLGLGPDADPAVLPLILLILSILLLANQPLSAWLDRAEEIEADRAALDLTGDPVAYCSLMVRLARINQADMDPPAWRQWFWSHHPSVLQRFRFGQAWADNHDIPIGPGAIPLPSPAEP